MSILQSQLTVIEDGVRLITVYGGPRGTPGAPGAPGNPGTPGRSITVRGDWVSNQTYVPGDAVASRTSSNPGLTSLWIVRDGKAPVQGTRPHEAPADWIEVGAAGEDATASGVLRITQALHPFTVIGQPVAFSEATGKYQLADARDRDLLPVGLVREVVDDDEFALQFTGIIPDVDPTDLLFDPAPPAGRGTGDWVPGVIYYLSSVPGMVQERDPAKDGFFSVPVAIATQRPDGAPADLSLLTWGPGNLASPGSVSEIAPANPKQGDLWFRTGAWPGLYIAIEDPTGSLVMWVQANG